MVNRVMETCKLWSQEIDKGFHRHKYIHNFCDFCFDNNI